MQACRAAEQPAAGLTQLHAGDVPPGNSRAPGLPNPRRRSCRNRLVASAGHADYVEWQLLVGADFGAPGRQYADRGRLTKKRSRHGLEARRKAGPGGFSIMIFGLAIDFLVGIFVGGVFVWLYYKPRLERMQRRIEELELSDQTHFNKWMQTLQKTNPPKEKR
jgi:hypothetical protein